MRTIVKMILPVAAFMLASAGAVSTKAAKESKADDVLITGYIHATSTSCDPIEVDCQIQNSGQMCKFGSPVQQNVYRTNACADVLWKRLP